MQAKALLPHFSCLLALESLSVALTFTQLPLPVFAALHPIVCRRPGGWLLPLLQGSLQPFDSHCVSVLAWE